MTADKPPEWMKLKATLPAIVLIEMDEITLELYQRELSKTFAVYGFTETEKVLETIKHGNIQAVVIEPEIQSGKGWELIRAIRDIYPVQTLPIVICSTLEPNNAHGNIQAVVIEPEIQSGKGWELIRAIRDIYPVQTLPIVICSTLEPNNAQIAADVTKYLTKPILPKFLREKLLEIIEKQGLAYEHG